MANQTKKVALVFGTRPEAIKLAPVLLALKREEGITPEVCVTAQHRQMLDQVLGVFEVVSDVDLDLMKADQALPSLTARAMVGLDEYLSTSKPDLVLVQGDTTTTFCAAMASFYNKIPVGHVEAGLRTHDLAAPWPEEANRALIARLATLQFAPTEGNRKNLLDEGVPASAIHVTGNTGIDALFIALKRLEGLESPPEGLSSVLQPGNRPRRLVLITGHRRESLGPGLLAVCHAIAELASLFPDVNFVYPVHLNPKVRGAVRESLGAKTPHNVHLIEPLPYLSFVFLMNRSDLILTDSGGIQEEAPSLGKPVLVLRDKTERPESVASGNSKLVGTDAKRIIREVVSLLTDSGAYGAMSKATNPYGDGRASTRIVQACKEFLNSRAS